MTIEHKLEMPELSWQMDVIERMHSFSEDTITTIYNHFDSFAELTAKQQFVYNVAMDLYDAFQMTPW